MACQCFIATWVTENHPDIPETPFFWCSGTFLVLRYIFGPVLVLRYNFAPFLRCSDTFLRHFMALRHIFAPFVVKGFSFCIIVAIFSGAQILFPPFKVVRYSFTPFWWCLSTLLHHFWWTFYQLSLKNEEEKTFKWTKLQQRFQISSWKTDEKKPAEKYIRKKIILRNISERK